jgi:hypothetical protein
MNYNEEIDNVCKSSKCKFIKDCIKDLQLRKECLDEIKRGN